MMVIEVIICITIPVPKGQRQRSLDHAELKHRIGHELYLKTGRKYRL